MSKIVALDGELVELVSLELVGKERTSTCVIVCHVEVALARVALVAEQLERDSRIGAGASLVARLHLDVVARCGQLLQLVRLAAQRGGEELAHNQAVVFVRREPPIALECLLHATATSLFSYDHFGQVPAGAGQLAVVADAYLLEALEAHRLQLEDVQLAALELVEVGERLAERSLARVAALAEQSDEDVGVRAGAHLVARVALDHVGDERQRLADALAVCRHLAHNRAVLFVRGEPTLTRKREVLATRQVLDLDAIQVPAGRHARVVVRDPHLERAADVGGRLHLERVALSCLEKGRLVVCVGVLLIGAIGTTQLDLVRLAVLAINYFFVVNIMMKI